MKYRVIDQTCEYFNDVGTCISSSDEWVCLQFPDGGEGRYRSAMVEQCDDEPKVTYENARDRVRW